MRLFPTLAALLALAAPAAAQQPLVTDRPDFTESAIAVERLQLEAGYTFSRAGETEEHTLGEVLVRIPAASRLEVRLGLNSYVRSRGPDGDAAGFEDASLGMKLELAGGSPRFDPLRPAAAVLATTTLPTGTETLREASLQPEAVLALAWPLSERAGLGTNLGYAYAGAAGDRIHRLSGSVALGYALTERLGAYIEPFGFLPLVPEGTDTGHVNAGLTYGVSSDFQIDGRVGTGSDGAYFVGLGLAHRW